MLTEELDTWLDKAERAQKVLEKYWEDEEAKELLREPVQALFKKARMALITERLDTLLDELNRPRPNVLQRGYMYGERDEVFSGPSKRSEAVDNPTSLLGPGTFGIGKF